MYEWSRVIFAKKSKFHDAGGPDTVVLPKLSYSIVGYKPPVKWQMLKGFLMLLLGGGF